MHSRKLVSHKRSDGARYSIGLPSSVWLQSRIQIERRHRLGLCRSVTQHTTWTLIARLWLILTCQYCSNRKDRTLVSDMQMQTSGQYTTLQLLFASPCYTVKVHIQESTSDIINSDQESSWMIRCQNNINIGRLQPSRGVSDGRGVFGWFMLKISRKLSFYSLNVGRIILYAASFKIGSPLEEGSPN